MYSVVIVYSLVWRRRERVPFLSAANSDKIQTCTIKTLLPAAMADTNLVDATVTFDSLDLDPRILRALSKQGFANPTLVQARAIPLALEGKDILARARTGSGKTLAYLLPIIQKALIASNSNDKKSIQALVLVPTRELAEQVTLHLEKILIYCQKHIKCVNLASSSGKKRRADGSHANAATSTALPLDASKADIVISTPAKIVSALDTLDLSTLKHLVIDEADLVLSYGYEDDLRTILQKLPKIIQSFLMSATMTKDVETLKGLVLRNPALLRLEEDDESDYITHYVVRPTPEDKFLLIYVVFKLKLVKGKSIIFVNSIDRCYRLKLFLEHFGVRACVLNSELPVNSRFHIVQEFNKGIYDYIIATDEGNTASLQEEVDSDAEHATETGATETVTDTPTASMEVPKSTPSKKRKKHATPDNSEYGVTRGIDFVGVAAVINFDFPATHRAFVHRAGRTARAGRKGMTLSFVVNRNASSKADWDLKGVPLRNEEKVLARVAKSQEKKGAPLKDYVFDMKQVEGFRYRMGDALRSVTKAAVREARIKELKDEVLNSERLKTHFEDNPQDLHYLRHDKPLQHASRIQPHLKHVPSYLLPKVAGVTAAAATAGAHLSASRPRRGKTFRGQKPKRKDPLRKFEYGGITKLEGNKRKTKTAL